MFLKKPIGLAAMGVLAIGLLAWLWMGLAPKSPNKGRVVSYPVRLQALHQSLYFTGIIRPIRETALTCPIDAIVETMQYQYGQAVKQGDVVLTLNSSELEKQYNDTLTEYLKAKDNYSMVAARFNGTKELWNTGLISKNTYLGEKSSVNTARIGLLQSTHKLSELLHKMDDPDNADLSTLKMAQFDKVQQALTSHHNLIHMKASADGLLLYPPKESQDKSGHIQVGAAVKAGQVIALIGNVTGVHVEIEIPETDINTIHVGMLAKITGPALGKHQLLGRVASVNTQALSGNTGASAFFSAMVVVKKLTPKQQNAIKVGMSAAIELMIDKRKQVIIPIKAVQQVNGKRMVTIQNKHGSDVLREVTTGIATANSVVIERGLKAGDVVRYDA